MSLPLFPLAAKTKVPSALPARVTQTESNPRKRVDGKKESYVKIDVYQVVTDRIIGLLESGTAPWHRPWKGNHQAPQNFISRKVYRGINSFLLHAAGYASPFWLTFKQVQSLDARVKKGEHSFPVIFWKIFEDDERTEKRKVPLLRYYNVFNVAQCEGIKMLPAPDANGDFHPLGKCEQVVAEMPARPAIEHGSARACYSPVQDMVRMPEAKLFESAETYYGTLFHELTHATGHASRLARKEIIEPNRFGSDPYSREELVAEMGAAFLCGHCAIENSTVDQSASYIQAWLERLVDDRKLVIQAAAQAQKACDFILGFQHGKPESVGESSSAVALHDSSPPSQPMNAPSARILKIEPDGDLWAGKIKPKIRLKGCWLERAGFKAGNRVSVKCISAGFMELRAYHAVSALNDMAE